MALIIAFVNKSNLAEISDYEVKVYVNEHHIAGPFKVNGHRRSDGWQKLVKQFAGSLTVEKHKFGVTSLVERKFNEPIREVQNIRRCSKIR